MTTFIFANNVNTTLAGGISTASTSITVSSTLNLPTTIPTGSYLALTLNDAATRTVYEIVYVTAITGATLTVIRGQEGTAAQNWLTGDFVFSGPTAGQMQNFQQTASTGVTPGTYGSSTQVPQFTVNAQGQITGITNVAIAFPVTSFNGRSGAIVLNNGDVTTALGYTPVNKAGDSMTGAFSINTSSSGNIPLTITNTAGNGAQIVLTGTGSTTPTKTLRSFGGLFQIINSAGSAAIFACDDSGNLSNVGQINGLLSVNNSTLILNGTGGAVGAVVELQGQGSTTPNKFIRVNAGNLEIVNSGNTAVVSTMTDGGSWTHTGNYTNNGGTINLNGTGSGAVLWLNGNGSASPNKMIRARAGNLEFVNSANSAIITTMDDSGDWNFSGALTTGAGVTINGGLQVNGTIQNTGTVNFYTSSSDEMLKSGIHQVEPEPLHRLAPWMGYRWLADGAYGEGPIAQQMQQAKPMYVREQDGQIVFDSKTGQQRLALGIAETRIGLEVAYWAANGVDRLEARLAALETRCG